MKARTLKNGHIMRQAIAGLLPLLVLFACGGKTDGAANGADGTSDGGKDAPPPGTTECKGPGGESPWSSAAQCNRA